MKKKKIIKGTKGNKILLFGFIPKEWRAMAFAIIMNKHTLIHYMC